MSENDRVAIHEVMEQQTVTIAKSGIHASLNARCSVLAAANPVHGQYDRTRRPQENIGLPDSLLSRFDLLFIVLDQLDPVSDRRLSEHVLRSHQYRKPGTIMEPEPLYATSLFSIDDPSDTSKSNAIWNRGGATAQIHSASSDFLSKDFLRKYMHYAKNKPKPTLTDTAMVNISDAYTQMRAKQTRQNLPVTARTLETLIRLSSAHAKARLSNNVEESDVEVAVDLVNFVLYGEISSPHDEIRNATTTNELTGKKRNNKNRDTDDEDDENRVDNTTASTGVTASTSSKDKSVTYNERETLSKISKTRDNLETVKSSLNQIRNDLHSAEDAIISFNDLMQYLDGALEEKVVRETLKSMEQANQIMIHDNDIHII
jgi:DNA replication licensing factor MCM3